ncbi:MAG: glycerol-3-phosphate acyltransferase PlsY [Verrucomicrobiales bacterium]|jgi:glycerol-3-phosphate acyltransferase PlsY
MISLQLTLLILAAYVIGATPFGFLMGKSKGLDIRNHGSGNIGATNVLRIVGKKEGIFVFVLDVLKGLVPVLIGQKLATGILGDASVQLISIISVLIALATILGHNHPFWLKFKGGKGVATSGGALLALMPWAVLAAAVVWAILFYAKRYVSLASIFAALTVPIALFIQGAMRGRHELPLIVLGVLVAVLGIWRHRANIARLRAGTESRMVKKTKQS